MSLPPPIGYALWAATFTQTTSGRKAVVTMGCKPAVGATAAGTRASMSATMFGAAGALRVSLLDTSWSLTQQYVLLNSGGVLTSDTSITNTPGTASLSVLPPNSAMVINKHTALAGRQYRGHMQVPAGYIDITQVSEEGVIAAGFVTARNTDWANTVAAAITNNVPFQLMHDVPLAGGVPFPTPITSMVCSGLLGTQRRRLRR